MRLNSLCCSKIVGEEQLWISAVVFARLRLRGCLGFSSNFDVEPPNVAVWPRYKARGVTGVLVDDPSTSCKAGER